MILKKKEIGQTVSNRLKATPYLFKFKPFSHLENCQTVANRFAKILEILVAKPSNRHEPPRQSVAKSPRAIACNCEPRHVFPSCQKSDAWNGYGESKYFCITCDIMQSARPSNWTWPKPQSLFQSVQSAWPSKHPENQTVPNRSPACGTNRAFKPFSETKKS